MAELSNHVTTQLVIEKLKFNNSDIEIHTSRWNGVALIKKVTISTATPEPIFYESLKQLVDGCLLDLGMPMEWSPKFHESKKLEDRKDYSKAMFNQIKFKQEPDERIGAVVTMEVYHDNYNSPIIINTPYQTECCVGDSPEQQRMSEQTSRNVWSVVDRITDYLNGIRAQRDLFTKGPETEKETSNVESITRKGPTALIGHTKQITKH